MSSLEVWLIIILVLGVIASNLAVLKYSNKFKMTQFGKPQDKPEVKTQGDSGHSGKSGLNENGKDGSSIDSEGKNSVDKANADKANTGKDSADKDSR